MFKRKFETQHFTIFSFSYNGPTLYLEKKETHTTKKKNNGPTLDLERKEKQMKNN